MIPIDEAAAASGVHRDTILRLIAQGLVTTERREQYGHVYVSLAEIRAALADAPAAPPEHTRTRRRRQDDDEHDAEKEDRA